MHARRPAGTKTVGDVLCHSASDKLSGAKKPRYGSVRLFSHDASAFRQQQPVQPSTPREGKPRRAAVIQRRNQRSRSAGSGASRRPVDEALFCALRMESQADVLRQLRAHGLAMLVKDFRTLCSSLSLHNIRVEEFTFLCAAVLQCDLRPRDCEVVFAFLRAERAWGGGISVAHLLERLRTLFEPLEVVCALQLKCLLETRRLDNCNVSLNELQKAEAGLRSLLVDDPLDIEVGAQWEHLEAELQRLHVRFSVPVPTFRSLVRRSARAVRSAVRSLGWDGKIQRHLWQEEDEEPRDDGVQEPLHAFDVGSLSKCTVDEICNEGGVQDKSAAVLSAVEKLYHHRLALGAQSLVAAERLGLALGANVRAASRVSSFSSPNSAADPTHPRFKADLYAVSADAPSCKGARREAYATN
ncbi:hypothetical protein CGC21_5140 [Leishmania donovani]|uniref:Uncharacterized protein n=2 Tax=Leishmania donovani TaxID=5661 RepID=A0A504XGC8_LEIDO|nr:hypothetical protein CGC21_5140 [Leishmania donovani]